MDGVGAARVLVQPGMAAVCVRGARSGAEVSRARRGGEAAARGRKGNAEGSGPARCDSLCLPDSWLSRPMGLFSSSFPSSTSQSCFFQASKQRTCSCGFFSFQLRAVLKASSALLTYCQNPLLQLK